MSESTQEKRERHAVTAKRYQHITPIQSDTMAVTWDNGDFEITVNVTRGHPHLACITVSVTTKRSLDTLSVLTDHRKQSELNSEDITAGPPWHRGDETWADFEASFDKTAAEVASRRMVAGEKLLSAHTSRKN